MKTVYASQRMACLCTQCFDQHLIFYSLNPDRPRLYRFDGVTVVLSRQASKNWPITRLDQVTELDSQGGSLT